LEAGLSGPHGAEWSNALPISHGRFDLQVAPAQIDADAIAVDAGERVLGFHVAAAAFEHHHQLALVVYVLGQRRVRHGAAVGHDGVGGFGKEERRLAHVLAHLLDVLDVIAADAPQPADRKILAGAGNRNGGLRRLGMT
jgi:hypothetical protein